jgi:hypothetical protein
MLSSKTFSHLIAVLCLSLLLQVSESMRMIESTSLIPCMANSRFSATLFNITFSPDDATLSIRVNGIASMTGKVTAKLTVIAYGFSAMEKTLDPCDPNLEGFQGMCPMTPGQLTLMSTIPVDANVANKIPGMYLGRDL